MDWEEYIKFLDNFPGSDRAASDAIEVFQLYGHNKKLFIKMYIKTLDCDYGEDFLKKVADYTFKNAHIVKKGMYKPKNTHIVKKGMYKQKTALSKSKKYKKIGQNKQLSMKLLKN